MIWKTCCPALLPGFILVLLLSSFDLPKKTVVRFNAGDGTVITADHYLSDKNLPYVIMFHQEMSSRGEFDSIVERVVKIGYNCLSVDLRSGNRYGFVNNETARSVRGKNQSVRILDALQDVKASVDYVMGLSEQPVILMGSGSSASLALMEGKENKDVKAVIALSPGEYFRPDIEMKTFLEDFPKMVFVGSTGLELPFIQDMFSGVDINHKVIFHPVSGQGARGTAALLSENPTKDEYWLSLILFFRTIR